MCILLAGFCRFVVRFQGPSYAGRKKTGKSGQKRGNRHFSLISGIENPGLRFPHFREKWRKNEEPEKNRFEKHFFYFFPHFSPTEAKFSKFTQLSTLIWQH